MTDEPSIRRGAADAPAGLCASCLHARPVASARGSVFVMCGRSKDDAGYPKYPRLPVVRCAGWEAEGGTGDRWGERAT